MNDAQILEMIQTEARKIAESVYADKGTQYGVPDVPTHTHNNVDSLNFPVSNLDGVQVLSGKNGPAIATSGVVSPLALGNQGVAQGTNSIGYGYQATGKAAQFITVPIPVIYGHGVGVDSQFNGGIAPTGTVLFFSNPGAATQLWVNVDGTDAGWYHADFT